MAANEIHLGDVGTVFELTVMDDTEVVDISSATVMQITFKKPDGSTVTKTAVHVTDGTDGKMKYTTAADDLDKTGDWEIQGFVDLPGGEWHTDVGNFTVHKNL